MYYLTFLVLIYKHCNIKNSARESILTHYADCGGTVYLVAAGPPFYYWQVNSTIYRIKGNKTLKPLGYTASFALNDAAFI